MNGSDNPYSGNNGSYGAASVSYGQPAPTADKGALVKDTTTADFKADVIDASKERPILVDFWAPWCGPCRQLGPAIEKVVKNAKGRVALVKMNIDDHPAVAGQLGIQSIPAVIAFKNGQPVDGFMGAVPEREIEKFIDKVAGPAVDPAAEVLAMATEARDAGELERAAQIYGSALQQGLVTPEVCAGLIEVMLDMGDIEGAKGFIADLPDEISGDKAFAPVHARIKLADETSGLGDPVALADRIAADPADHQARFDLSAIHNARGERDKAAELLLQIMKADRSWNDDGARKRLLEYFEAWGMADPATLSARRRLSTLLFS